MRGIRHQDCGASGAAPAGGIIDITGINPLLENVTNDGDQIPRSEQYGQESHSFALPLTTGGAKGRKRARRVT
jgi:hypothetical protein